MVSFLIENGFADCEKSAIAILEHMSQEWFDYLQERYYEPNERLPSNKTPMQKAIEKSRARARTVARQSPAAQERWGRHYDTTQTKVRHGADNPDPNPHVSHKDKDEISVQSDRGDIEVKHKPSGVSFYAYKSDDTPGVRTLEWGHNRNRSNMSSQERNQLARTAKRVYDKHVSHRLPTGDIVHNTPIASTNPRTGQEKPVNRRAKIYQRSGFGPVDSEGDQFGKVNRQPSPRQRAKGRNRISPLNPARVKSELSWNDDWED
jgi:hypothetical protein